MFNLVHDRCWKHELSVALGHEAENKECCNLETSDTATGRCSDVFFYLSLTPRGTLSYKLLGKTQIHLQSHTSYKFNPWSLS